MADHWVAEVFPPKFQFVTVDEMLKSAEEEERETEKIDSPGDVYRKVYCEQEKAKKISGHVEKLKSSHPSRREKGHTVSSVRSERERKREKKPQKKEDEECIWSQSELKMLRKFLQKAKMQNLKLAAMLESAQDEINVWKEKFKDVSESDDLVKSRLLILKKKYERLKVNYRALKEDVRRYHATLRVTREDFQELKTEKSEIEKSLNETKSKLDMEKLHAQQLKAKLGRKEKEFEENVKSHEYFLNQQHLFEKAKLQKQIDRLSEEFEKERQDNDLNKKALEHLRSHFANLKINQDGTEGSKVMENMLSVIDIDYLPT